MTLWLTLAVNSIAFGGLPFLLSAGFSLMLGLVPISNLMHGSFFMLGAYFGVTLLAAVGQFLGRGAGERPRYGDHWRRRGAALRRLVGQELSDVPPGNSQCSCDPYLLLAALQESASGPNRNRPSSGQAGPVVGVKQS